jgi:DNA replication protein DnaC
MSDAPPPLPFGADAPAPVAASNVPDIEDLPAAAAPDPDCERCDRGVVITQEGEWMRAEVCDCIGVCGRCNGNGRVVARVDGTVRTGRCRCQLPGDRARLLSAAQLPGRYVGASLGSFMRGVQESGDMAKMDAMMGVSHWLQAFTPGDHNRGLVLHGPVGRGKTHLLVGLLRDLVLLHGVHVRFVEFTRLLAALRAGFSEGRSGSELMNELVAVPVLGIDELGKGRLTDWELTVIDELISRRYNAMATTLGTTNFAPGAVTGAAPTNAALSKKAAQTLGDRVGERVHSRLVEMCDFVEVAGVDFRELQKVQRQLGGLPQR